MLTFLAHLWDVSVESPSTELVFVVFECQDVLCSDLSGLPLDRDIDLCIDLKISLPRIGNLFDQL